MVVCLERGADLHMVQLKPLPLTCLLLQYISDWFYLSGTSLPGYHYIATFTVHLLQTASKENKNIAALHKEPKIEVRTY